MFGFVVVFEAVFKLLFEIVLKNMIVIAFEIVLVFQIVFWFGKLQISLLWLSLSI